MKLKTTFLIFTALFTCMLIIINLFLYRHGGIQYYVVIGFSITVILFLIYFYRKVINPLKSITSGMDLLREQDFSSKLLPVGQSDADKIVKMFNEMMQQLKNERLRLLEQNNFLNQLIEASPMGVILFSLDDKISLVNDAALRFMGFENIEEVKNKTLNQISSNLAIQLKKIPANHITTIRLNDSELYRCSRLSFFDRGFARQFILIESLTAEVFKAEKKAYEKVIRMIAHEVNNTVAGVTSTLTVVNESVGDKDLCEIVEMCASRCINMSRFITNFASVAKIPEPHLLPTNINESIKSCAIILENMCQSKNIKLNIELCDEKLMAMIDIALFEQVIINVTKNSIESIESNGEITIRTAQEPARLEIIDNGKGIDADTEQKLFSPFFSTKPTGQGIGLMIIREILIKHNFKFSLSSYSDGLTRFIIYTK